MQTCTLGSLNLDLAPWRVNSIDFGAPPSEIHEVSSARADLDLQSDFRTSAYRDVLLTCTAQCSSASALFSALAGLAAQIGQPSNTLVVQPDGCPNSVTYQIGRNPEPDFPFNHATESSTTATVSFLLKAQPYAHGTTLQTVTLANGGCPLVTSATLTGDRPVPVSLTFTLSGLRALYAALLYPPAGHTPVVGDYLQQAETMSWTGGAGGGQTISGITGTASGVGTGPYTITNISVANPTVVTCGANVATGTTVTISGSNSTPSVNGTYTATNVSSTAFSIPVNVTSAGSAGTVQPGASGNLRVVDGGTGEQIASLAFSVFASQTWTLYDLGEVTVPLQPPNPSDSSNTSRSLTFYLSSDGTHTAYLDYIVLVPTTQLAFYNNPSGSSINKLDLRSDGSLYQSQYANYTNFSGGPLVLGAAPSPGCTSYLLLVADDLAADAAPVFNPAPQLQYLPRFVLWGVAS